MKNPENYCKKKGKTTTELGEFGFVRGYHKGCKKQCFDCMADVGQKMRDGKSDNQEDLLSGGIANVTFVSGTDFDLDKGECFLGRVDRGVSPDQINKYMRDYPKLFFGVGEGSSFASKALNECLDDMHKSLEEIRLKRIAEIKRLERERKWYMKLYRKLQTIWK
jgi:hypothetical protein